MSVLFSETSLDIAGVKVRVAFTSKDAGNLGLHVGDDPCGVLRNRSALEKTLGLKAGSFAYLNQVHGVEVARFSQAGVAELEVSEQAAQEALEKAPVADAALSCDGRPLAVMVADCIPLVLVGSGSSSVPILAVAHAGRKGLLNGVIEQTVAKMRAEGAEEIRIWCGPSICGSCYEVPEEMRRESEELAPGIASETSWGTPALDLPAYARKLAEGLQGVVAVDTSLATCTYEDQSVFSHRRAEPGRIAGLVWIEES